MNHNLIWPTRKEQQFWWVHWCDFIGNDLSHTIHQPIIKHNKNTISFILFDNVLFLKLEYKGEDTPFMNTFRRVQIRILKKENIKTHKNNKKNIKITKKHKNNKKNIKITKKSTKASKEMRLIDIHTRIVFCSLALKLCW